MKLEDIARKLLDASLTNKCSFDLNVQLDDKLKRVNFCVPDGDNYNFYNFYTFNEHEHGPLLKAALKDIATKRKQAAQRHFLWVMNMHLKPLYTLPELTKTQEWICDGGCSNIKPRLTKNIFQSTICCMTGMTLEAKYEEYFVCSGGHVVGVWDDEIDDEIEVDDKYYEATPTKIMTNCFIDEDR